MWHPLWWSCLVTSDSVTSMGCNLPGSSVHGISQERILEWVAISFSRGPSQPRDPTPVSRTAIGHFTAWATRRLPVVYAICKFWVSRKVLTFLQISKQKKKSPLGQTHKGSEDKATCGEGSWPSWGNVCWHRQTPLHSLPGQRLQQVSGPQSEDKGAWWGV